MKLRRLLLVALSLECAFGADGALTVTGAPSDASAGPRDTGVFTLPGAPPRRVAPLKEPSAAPKEPAAEPKPISVAPKPVLAEARKPVLPEAFKADSSVYLQRFINKWKKLDARSLLGQPVRRRIAYDENKAPAGEILAYRDPSGRFQEIELDFGSDNGTLLSVFAYPKQMTWEECRKIWGGNVNTTQAEKGHTFYSYLNRKLDVLVDNGGKVISLGLY